ncbi:MAG: TonB-dependent receptor plug domain-containing protein [Desulfuromonadales bacterium]|nr:TonB-dependent receptor plug domain-containing protein [Desulfuromonadales bacterium]
MLSKKRKTLWPPVALLTSLLLLVPVVLFAGGDEPGDELGLFGEIPSVFSASKYAQKATEAPSSVTVITAEEIRSSNYRTLSDVLRSVRGFYISNDHNYEGA